MLKRSPAEPPGLIVDHSDSSSPPSSPEMLYVIRSAALIRSMPKSKKIKNYSAGPKAACAKAVHSLVH